jgi:hypothetical protein
MASAKALPRFLTRPQPLSNLQPSRPSHMLEPIANRFRALVAALLLFFNHFQPFSIIFNPFSSSFTVFNHCQPFWNPTTHPDAFSNICHSFSSITTHFRPFSILFTVLIVFDVFSVVLTRFEPRFQLLLTAISHFRPFSFDIIHFWRVCFWPFLTCFQPFWRVSNRRRVADGPSVSFCESHLSNIFY